MTRLMYRWRNQSTSPRLSRGGTTSRRRHRRRLGGRRRLRLAISVPFDRWVEWTSGATTRDAEELERVKEDADTIRVEARSSWLSSESSRRRRETREESAASNEKLAKDAAAEPRSDASCADAAEESMFKELERQRAVADDACAKPASRPQKVGNRRAAGEDFRRWKKRSSEAVERFAAAAANDTKLARRRLAAAGRANAAAPARSSSPRSRAGVAPASSSCTGELHPARSSGSCAGRGGGAREAPRGPAPLARGDASRKRLALAIPFEDWRVFVDAGCCESGGLAAARRWPRVLQSSGARLGRLVGPRSSSPSAVADAAPGRSRGGGEAPRRDVVNASRARCAGRMPKASGARGHASAAARARGGGGRQRRAAGDTRGGRRGAAVHAVGARPPPQPSAPRRARRRPPPWTREAGSPRRPRRRAAPAESRRRCRPPRRAGAQHRARVAVVDDQVGDGGAPDREEARTAPRRRSRPRPRPAPRARRRRRGGAPPSRAPLHAGRSGPRVGGVCRRRTRRPPMRISSRARSAHAVICVPLTRVGGRGPGRVRPGWCGEEEPRKYGEETRGGG